MIRSSVAAAILAGGRARRFGGTLKNTLVLTPRGPGLGVDEGASRIIDRQLAALRAVADPIFIVAPDPRPFASLGLEVVPDILPDLGALGGIYTAVETSPCERTLVVAGDLPFLPGALLERLVCVSNADVVVPRGPRGYEPLCAVYSRRCRVPLRRRLEAGLLKASVMLDDVVVEEIGPELLAVHDPDGLLFVNVNTPHDFERARDLIESMPQQRGDRITDDRPPS